MSLEMAHTTPEAQIVPETHVTADVLNDIVPIYCMVDNPKTLVKDLELVEPIPTFEEHYPKEDHPDLYDDTAVEAIKAYNEEVKTINNIIEAAHNGTLEDTAAAAETVEDGINHMLVLVRGEGKVRPAEFMRITGRQDTKYTKQAA